MSAETIFVSVASYRDPELVKTVKSAVDNAKRPGLIRFGIVDQSMESESYSLDFCSGCSVIRMHPRQARGAGFARQKAMQMYVDETYYLQIDSHTRFVKDWDEILKDQLSAAQKLASNNNVILSAFPPPYEIMSNGEENFLVDDPDRPRIPTGQRLTRNKRGEWTAQRFPIKSSLPEVSNTVLAGFIFAPGKIVNEIPYDPEISFFGEEVCFAMRAWTRGWDIYSPSEIVMYHFYSRPSYPKIWKDVAGRKVSWATIEAVSKDKQRRVLTGVEEGIFGAGMIRTLKEYEEFCGVDFYEVYTRN